MIFVFLAVWSLVLSAPVMLALLVARRRINRTTGCALLALTFAAACSYTLWRLEWFDVWRHGIPGPSLLFIYGCYAAAYGALGWFIAGAMLPYGDRWRRRVGPAPRVSKPGAERSLQLPGR